MKKLQDADTKADKIIDLTARGEIANQASVRLDAPACHLLDFKDMRPGQSIKLTALKDLGISGSVMRTDCQEETVRTGLWLLRSIKAADKHHVMERLICSDGSCIDLRIAGENIQLRHCPADTVIRTIRHDLSNQLNSIKVNAELVRVLAERAEQPRLVAAAARILDDVDRAGIYQKSDLPSLVAQAPRLYEPAEALSGLLGTAAASGDLISATVNAQWPKGSSLTSAWLNTVGRFFQRIALSANAPPVMNLQQSTDASGITVIVNAETKTSPSKEPTQEPKDSAATGLIGLAEKEWARGRHLDGSLAALSSASGPFGFLIDSHSLQFRGRAFS